MSKMFRGWKKKDTPDLSPVDEKQSSRQRNESLDDLKMKFGELGNPSRNVVHQGLNRNNSSHNIIQETFMNGLRGTISPLAFTSDADDETTSRPRSKTDGVKSKNGGFSEALSDISKFSREAALRKEKHAAMEKKSKLLDKLDRCRKMTNEANEIATEVQAYIFFRVRLVSAIDGNDPVIISTLPEPVVEKPPSRPTSLVKSVSSFTLTRPSATTAATTGDGPTRKFGKFGASSFAAKRSTPNTTDVIHRKLIEGTISQAEYAAIKQKMKEAGELDMSGHQQHYMGDSDDSDGENEAINAEMESILDSAVSHEKMQVVAQCYCLLPRREVLRSTGRVLGWGTGPAIITTSARWPQFTSVHAHFAPPPSSLPQPSQKDEEEDEDEEDEDDFQMEGVVPVLSPQASLEDPTSPNLRELPTAPSEAAVEGGGMTVNPPPPGGLRKSSSMKLSRNSSARRLSSSGKTARKSGLKNSVSFGEVDEPKSNSLSPKRKGVSFGVEDDLDGDTNPSPKAGGVKFGVGFAEEGDPSPKAGGVKFGVGFAEEVVATSVGFESAPSPRTSNTPSIGGGLKRKSKERRKSIDSNGEGLEAARHDLMELVGEAMRLVNTNQGLLKQLQKDTAAAPPHLAKQVESLMPIAEKDVRVVNELRASSRAVSETIRSFSEPQKQVASELLLKKGRRRVVENSNIDKEAMKLEAASTIKIINSKNVEEDQELVLFEVDTDTMDDVLRSLQRFQMNVRRVVKKGNQATSKGKGGAAMAAASAAALAVANKAGVEMTTEHEAEANQAELKSLSSLSSLSPEQQKRLEYLKDHVTNKQQRRSLAIEATMAAAEAANTVKHMSSAATAAAAVAALHFGGDDDDDENGNGKKSESSQRKPTSRGGGGGANDIGDVTSSLRLLFRAVDTDGSGEIDAEELHAAMTELGLVDDDDRSASVGGRAVTIFEAFDRDQSGSLEFDEFERLIRNRLHRNAIQPFVTHEAAYSALLRHLGIDIPTLPVLELENGDMTPANIMSLQASSKMAATPKGSSGGGDFNPMSPQVRGFDDLEALPRSLPRASLTRAIAAPPLPRTANTRARRIANAANIGGGGPVPASKPSRRPSLLSTPHTPRDDEISAFAAVAAFPLAAASAAKFEKQKDSNKMDKRVSMIAPRVLPRVNSETKIAGNQDRMMKDAAAQVRLGHKSLKQRRYGPALEWFSLAANQDNAEGQFEVARMMDKGLGLQSDGRDIVGAVSWYDAAARGGEPRAMFKLANLFKDGEGVEKDRELSEQWMKLAAESGVAAAQFSLASKIFRQAAVLPPKWRDKSSVQAMEWLKRAAAQGHCQAMLDLGKKHLNGTDSADHNPELAVRLFESICNTAVSFPPQTSNHEIGGDVLMDASMMVDMEADFDGGGGDVSNSYGTDAGGNPPHDPWEGQSAYDATATVAEAEYLLSCCHRDGNGVSVSETLGALWMERAADHGSPEAMFDLSFMIAHGYGCLTADPVVAVQWLRSASDLGYDKASRLLAKQHKLSIEEEDKSHQESDSSNGDLFDTRSSTSLMNANINLSFQEKAMRRLSVVELAAALDEFVEEEEEEEEAAALAAAAIQKQKEGGNKDHHDSNQHSDASDMDEGNELEDGSGDEFDEIVSDDIQLRLTENLADTATPLSQFDNVRRSFLNTNTPRGGSGSFGSPTSPSPLKGMIGGSSGIGWDVLHDQQGSKPSVDWTMNSMLDNPLRKKGGGLDGGANKNLDAEQALIINEAISKLRTIENALSEQQRHSQRWFDLLASFEAERRDAVEKKFLGSGSHISKLQGMSGMNSSTNLSSLRGLSLRSPLSRGGGGGGMNSGMGLLVLLGSEGASSLSALFSLLQSTESADVRAYDRLENLSDAWRKTSQSAIGANSDTHGTSSSSSSASDENTQDAPAYAKALAVALGEIGYLMAEEARNAADAIAELLLPCESAKMSLQARSSEVMGAVNSAVQRAKGSNTNVRVAWAGVADQHKLSNRRRHADVSRARRIVSASSSIPPSKEAAAQQVAQATAQAANFKSSTPDGDGGGGCKWLALRQYRAAINSERISCETAAKELKLAHEQASDLRVAASQVEREIVILALQARLREVNSLARHIRRSRLEHLELLDADTAKEKALETLSSNTKQKESSSVDHKAVGVSVGNNWLANDWSEERIEAESYAIRKILVPFIKDAVLERAHLSLTSLDLDNNSIDRSFSTDSSSPKKKSKRSQMLSGSFDNATIKATELIEKWARGADELIASLPSPNNGNGGRGSTMTSSLMMKKISLGRRTLPVAATLPAEILASLETCLCEVASIYHEESVKISNGGGFKSSFIRPEDHAIVTLSQSAEDAREAATALKAAPAMAEELEVSSSNTIDKAPNNRGSLSNNHNILKRSSSVWLSVQRRVGQSRPSIVDNMDNFNETLELTCGALVLTKEGFLHLFVNDNESEDTPVKTQFGSELSSPPTSFLQKCLFSSAAHNDDSSLMNGDAITVNNVIEPTMSIFMSAEPEGRRTAVNKVKPGVFRLHFTDSDASISEMSKAQDMGIRRSSSRGSTNAHTISLPPSLLSGVKSNMQDPTSVPSSSSSTVARPSSFPQRKQTVHEAESSIDGILVMVDSDDAANGWIEDLLRMAIRKEAKKVTSI